MAIPHLYRVIPLVPHEIIDWEVEDDPLVFVRPLTSRLLDTKNEQLRNAVHELDFGLFSDEEDDNLGYMETRLVAWSILFRIYGGSSTNNKQPYFVVEVCHANKTIIVGSEAIRDSSSCKTLPVMVNEYRFTYSPKMAGALSKAICKMLPFSRPK